MKFSIPIRTVTGLNAREHWAARARRVKKERQATALSWAVAIGRKEWPRLPLQITLRRISPATRPADTDNVQGACKAVRDALAALFGVDDGDETKIQWSYAQERGPWGVRVEIREEQKP